VAKNPLERLLQLRVGRIVGMKRFIAGRNLASSAKTVGDGRNRKLGELRPSKRKKTVFLL